MMVLPFLSDFYHHKNIILFQKLGHISQNEFLEFVDAEEVSQLIIDQDLCSIHCNCVAIEKG